MHTLHVELTESQQRFLSTRASSGGLPSPQAVVVSLIDEARRAESANLPAGMAVSIFDLFGKAPALRTADDIAAQIWEEREAWGEP